MLEWLSNENTEKAEIQTCLTYHALNGLYNVEFLYSPFVTYRTRMGFIWWMCEQVSI